MRRRWHEHSPIRYSTPTLKLLLLSVGTLGLAGIVKMAEISINIFFTTLELSGHLNFSAYVYVMLALAVMFIIVAVIERATRKDERQIKYLIIKRLCKYEYGNPLRLKDGELEPKVHVERADIGYRVRVTCPSAEFEKVSSLESVISDCLKGRFEGYAVVSKEEDVASRYVDYYIDNEEENSKRQTVYHSLEDMMR